MQRRLCALRTPAPSSATWLARRCASSGSSRTRSGCLTSSRHDRLPLSTFHFVRLVSSWSHTLFHPPLTPTTYTFIIHMPHPARCPSVVPVALGRAFLSRICFSVPKVPRSARPPRPVIFTVNLYLYERTPSCLHAHFSAPSPLGPFFPADRTLFLWAARSSPSLPPPPAHAGCAALIIVPRTTRPRRPTPHYHYRHREAEPQA